MSMEFYWLPAVFFLLVFDKCGNYHQLGRLFFMLQPNEKHNLQFHRSRLASDKVDINAYECLAFAS